LAGNTEKERTNSLGGEGGGGDMSVNDAMGFFGAFALMIGLNHMVMLIMDYQKEQAKKSKNKKKIDLSIFKTFKHRKKDRDEEEDK
jgi:hypothetical protein